MSLWLNLLLHILLQAALIARVLLRPHRNPAARLAWIVVILAVPVLGMIGYVLLGETNIGRARVARLRAVLAALPAPDVGAAPAIPADRQPLFRVGQSISGYRPCGGNAATVLPDSASAIAALVADIDAAQEHVHLLFYIWLPDESGTAVAEALCRAARRGVACRTMVDDLGSRLLIKDPLWARMEQAGVKLARALPVGNLLLRPFIGRIDLRNHRKIVVIDGAITYCGSQNCADAAFRIKAKFAPWVDVMVRFEGPVARQNQHLFASDWMTYAQEDLTALLRDAPPPATPGAIVAQVVASGPTARHSAMPEIFASLMYAAREDLVITTPYYVPDDSMQAALCAAAARGVATTIVLPARNDNLAVAAASRSYYGGLLGAGVRIFEYRGGLLHAKTVCVDGEVALIGSANMDRRSFDLNYENNILLHDAAATAALRARQDHWIADSRAVTAEEVAAWPMTRRLWNNGLAVVGPVL